MISMTLLVMMHAAPGFSNAAESLTISEFQLSDSAGKAVVFSPQPATKLTVVCFLGTECPLARLYGPRLSQLADEYAGRQVQFIGVNSNSQDSRQEVAEYSRELGLSFAVYKDDANQVADQFQARYQSEVFVLDEDFRVRYHGRIDDQYQPGISKPAATRGDLKLALDELLSGQSVSVLETDVAGCLIGRIKTPAAQAKYTFCRDVAAVLNRHCVECHRPGEIGPFSLTDYHEVIGWGDTMVETMDAGRMPPWHANPKHGHFRNSRAMPDADKEIIREWVAAGMPYGDPADRPELPEFETGWHLGREPDLVVKMRDRPFHVPASGTVEYQYFVVDPHLEEDRWVSAAQVIPGNFATVHHCIVFVRPPDGAEVRGVGYLAGYVPGQRSFQLPPGHARRVLAGSKLVFQMHYTPNGAEQDDITQLGMTFLPDSAVSHETFTLLGIEQEFEIPPRAADFPVPGRVSRLPKQAELLAITPHMHVRGKAFQVTETSGDTSEILLDVPRYDFNWQHVYELAEPVPLNGIDKLEFTARFDNSEQNPANPDPSQTVTWGDQTWEEMAIVFFEVSEPRQMDTAEEAAETAAPPAVVDSSFVSDFFARFDKNRDGRIEKLETPLGFRRYGFHHYDSNHDGELSREEIQTASQRPKRKR